MIIKAGEYYRQAKLLMEEMSNSGNFDTKLLEDYYNRLSLTNSSEVYNALTKISNSFYSAANKELDGLYFNIFTLYVVIPGLVVFGAAQCVEYLYKEKINNNVMNRKIYNAVSEASVAVVLLGICGIFAIGH